MEQRQRRIKPKANMQHKQNIDKQRPSISKGCGLELNVIRESSHQQLPSANNNLDYYDKVDHKTLDLIKTYRNVDLPCLKAMTEEQCVVRYLNDPFFRKKMEYEYEYLSKLKFKTKLSLITKQLQEECVKVNEMIGSKRKIRFKQIMANDNKHKMEQAEMYQNLLRKVSSQENGKLPHQL